MTYRNKKTGSVINIESELNGGDWERIKPSPVPQQRRLVIKMEPFASLNDIVELWREMSTEEGKRAEKLLPIVSDCLRTEADKVGKDLDKMITEKPYFESVVKSVVRQM